MTAKKLLITSVVVLCPLSLTPFVAQGEVPLLISFQGYLTDGANPVPDDDYDMTFSIYDGPEEETPLWFDLTSSGDHLY